MNRKHKAVALCRVSTKKQRLEGASLEAQETYIYDCAALFDATIEKIWSLDTSSKKGKNLARKDLQEIFQYCKKHKIRYFILDEIDRLMRSVDEYFWWKTEFRRIGVYLAFAKMPEITHEDNPMTVFKELVTIFQAEASNYERMTKAKDKMQAKIDQGLYPGVPHFGYKTSETKSIHVPDEPRFSLLQEAMQGLASGKFTLQEALKWLFDAGLKHSGGKKLDMYKFKKILKEAYYCGEVGMGSFKPNPNGVHKAMITREEFEIVSRIARGQKARFKINHNNPDFPANRILCEGCFIINGLTDGKFTGYRHHNGKQGNSRKYYDRYRCRSCGKAFLRDELHSSIEKFLDPVQLTSEAREELVTCLRKAWSEVEQDSLQKVSRLEARTASLKTQKGKLVLSLAENPELKEEIQEQIALKKSEIDEVETAAAEASNIEDDFNEFVEFSLNLVDDWKSNWWQLDHEDRDRCEQLLFPQLLRVNSKNKVSTPEISRIYRYGAAKKTPVGALNDLNGGPAGT